MTITLTFDAPFYTGGSTSGSGGTSIAEVGTVWDVAIGGRGYMLDLIPEGGGSGYSVKSMPLLQRYYLTQDTGNIGEQSLNPEDYWRRSVDSWANGSGQKFNDHDASTRTQFRTSKGIDPWTPGQLTLLPDTFQLLASANTNLQLVTAGTNLYALDGAVLKFTAATSFTTVTGTAMSTPTSICSDGFTVWVIDANRTYYTTRGSSTYAPYHTADCPGTLVRTAKGRLFTAALNVISTHSGAPGSATATSFFMHPNTDFTWVDVTEGPTAIYFAGFSGDKSIIYQTQIAPDGTALVIPTAAAFLPDGEIVRSIQGYLGVLLIGTDLGVRVAAIDGQGNLTVGDLVETTSAVRCFEPQSHFVWYGLTNYDGISSGLGRLDLGTFNDTAPAYATDLMMTGTGIVSSVVTFAGLRTFSVQGTGVFIEHTNKVSSGTIQSGGLNYALPDIKIAVKFDISYLAGQGTIVTALSSDDVGFVQIGPSIPTLGTTGGSTVIPAGLAAGRTHEVQLTLMRGVDPTAAPIIDRWTLLSNPAPERRVQILAALLLHQEVETVNGQTRRVNPRFERDQINAWMQSNEVIQFQDAEGAFAVTVDDFEWKSDNNVDRKNRVWNGTLMVTMKEVA